MDFAVHVHAFCSSVSLIHTFVGEKGGEASKIPHFGMVKVIV